MPRWFPLEPADDDFLRTAPFVFRYRIETAGPPAQLWDSISSEESVSAWGKSVRAVRWTTPRPFGVDSRREVELSGGLATVRERFYRWDEGERYSFYVVESNRPGLRRFAEDYVISAAGTGAVLDWTIAIEPQPAARVGFRLTSPLVRAAFGRAATEGQKYFAAQH